MFFIRATLIYTSHEQLRGFWAAPSAWLSQVCGGLLGFHHRRVTLRAQNP